TRSAAARCASDTAATIRSTFPSRSPTTELNCASAILMPASSKPGTPRRSEVFASRSQTSLYPRDDFRRDGDHRPAVPRAAAVGERRLRVRAPRRARGPLVSVAWLPAESAPRLPPPLERLLTIRPDGERLVLEDGDVLVAEAV